MSEEKKLGISFESADVYARSLGIQIEDYELVPVTLCLAHDQNKKPAIYSLISGKTESSNEKLGIENVVVSLLQALREYSNREKLNFICSIKLLCVNNMIPNGNATTSAYWVNTLTATGLRRKTKTKSTPPPPIVIPPPAE